VPTGVSDPYDVLGVARDADADTIKRAYRTLALRYHPDRNPGDATAEEQFKRISEAYATLRDPEARQRFDTYGHVGRGPVGARPDFSHVDWRVVFSEADIPIDWSRAGGIPSTGNVVFDTLFRGVSTLFRQAGLLPGEDRQVRLRIDLETARAGGQRRVRLPGPMRCEGCRGLGRDAAGACPTCGGSGRLARGLSVDVSVPAGVRSGSKLRLAGMGGPGQPPGDAYVVLDVVLPSGVRSLERDLATELFVTPLEAERGAEVNVLGMPVRLPARSRDGSSVRVVGGGLGGDLIVTIKIDVWRGLGRVAYEGARRAAAALLGRPGSDERKGS